MRVITRIYQDPLDVIWIHTARRCGIEVRRDSTVYASWDGSGVLSIGTADTLDADDSLAQMILHEMCHALTEGPDAWELPDWGLDIDNPAQRVREYACLRLQAALADRYGLREFFGSTTNFRRYYDQLPKDPLSDDGDPAVPIAQSGWQRAVDGPWSAAIDLALRSTSKIADIVRDFGPSDSLWSA